MSSDKAAKTIDWSRRVHFIWTVVIPALTASVPAYLRFLDGFKSSDIALAAIWGLAGGLVAVAAIGAMLKSRGQRSIAADIESRRVRLLEYHAMHLSWFRAVVTDPKTPDPTIDDGIRVIKKHRDMLLNLSPEVFPLSVADAFRDAQSYNFGEKRQFVAGFTKEQDRAILLARIDQLATAIRGQWIAYGGVKATAP